MCTEGTKVCSKCKVEKPFSEFSKHAKCKHGVNSRCKQCAREYSASLPLKYAEERSVSDLAIENGVYKNGYKVCTKCKVEKKFSEFSRNKLRKDGLSWQCRCCDTAHNLAHYEKHKDSVQAANKKWREDNKDILSAKDKIWRDANKDIVAAQNKVWRLTYPDRARAYKAKRRAAKRKAIPKWLTKEDLQHIQELYEIAAAFKLYTGQDYHVDHVLPLQGKTVCGLHCPANLRVIPAAENLSKSNKLIDPEAWD